MADDTTLPAPLVPAEVNLTDFPFMPLEVNRLRRSKNWLICKRRPELGFYMINLWTAAWHDRPAGSLEDDDDVLADLAMCSPEKWPEVRADVLRGWVKCSDGRLYHPVVAEKVRRAWEAMQVRRRRIDRRLEIESGEWTAIRAAVFARDDYTCTYCGARGCALECDHVVPVRLGGTTSMDNLATACLPCNRSKGAKTLTEWRGAA